MELLCCEVKSKTGLESSDRLCRQIISHFYHDEINGLEEAARNVRAVIEL